MSLSSNTRKYRVCAYFHKIKFGKNARITGFPRWGSEAYLISIGDNVTITQDVVFHTHDGGVFVLRDQFPGLNIFGRITIGNNVFIGSNVIIMPNTNIGNNVVIGSGSIVTKDIPDNSVAIGIPAKPIKNIEQYKEDCLSKSVIIPTGTSKQDRKKIILDFVDK